MERNLGTRTIRERGSAIAGHFSVRVKGAAKYPETYFINNGEAG